MNDWIYQNKVFELKELHKDYYGFVYLIENIHNSRFYIGKKAFWYYVKKAPLKGYKRKRIIKKESDWKTYFGSNEELKNDAKDSNYQGFNRKILVLCESKTLCSYYELKEQINRNVLLSERYYNQWISAKIRKNNLIKTS